MNSLLDGASAPTSRSPHQASGVKLAATTQEPGATSASAGGALRVHERMVATRRERIAVLAYLMAEARGFEPGHDADDWLRAELEIDAQDAGIALI